MHRDAYFLILIFIPITIYLIINVLPHNKKPKSLVMQKFGLSMYTFFIQT